MPYTNDPVGTPSDEIRFLLGDTKEPYDLSDNEVVYLLAQENGNPGRAAARGAEALQAKFSSAWEEKRVGPLLLRTFKGKADRYATLAKLLWSQASNRGVVPFAGGTSATDKIARATDPDRVKPTFKRRMMDYPAGSADIGRASDEELRP